MYQSQLKKDGLAEEAKKETKQEGSVLEKVVTDPKSVVESVKNP